MAGTQTKPQVDVLRDDLKLRGLYGPVALSVAVCACLLGEAQVNLFIFPQDPPLLLDNPPPLLCAGPPLPHSCPIPNGSLTPFARPLAAPHDGVQQATRPTGAR